MSAPPAPRPHRRMAAGALVVLVAAALVSLVAPAGATVGAPPAGGVGGTGVGPVPGPGVTTVAQGTGGKVAGMAIPNVDPQQSAAEVQRLHADGLNSISLFVWWWMPKQDSNVIERCDGTMAAQQGCNPTETDAELQVQMAAARQFGMDVILVPIFYCGTCEGGWRGTAQPSDPQAWFASYRQFIDHYADLATQNGARTLFVGSEMTSLESQTSQWEQVVSEARQHFSGQIGYEENWDVLGNAKFLRAVDLVGVSAYFPLDDGRSPGLGDLVADWTDSHASAYRGHNWVSAVANLARSSGKPILFGEVGYMSGDYAARQPYLNYLATTNWQLQSDLYQALLEKFENQPWWAGAVWWEWYLSDDTPKDNSRTPRGKTAEQLLAAWYARGYRPSDPTAPLVTSPAVDSPDDTEATRPVSGAGSGPGGPGSHQPTAGATTGSTAVGSAAGATTGGAGASHLRQPGGGRSIGGSGATAAGSSPASPAAGAGARPTKSRTVVALAAVAALLVLGALAVVARLMGGGPTARRA